MELECQLALKGIDSSVPIVDPSGKAKALAGGASDWRLLLQIDTDEDGPGGMCGDMGRIYFWIKCQDLRILRFDEAWLILQCS